MKFECFYYPRLSDSGELIHSNEYLKEFDFGDTVPSKTLYYNYGKRYAIYHLGDFYAVENGILKKSITIKDLKYPLNLVFNKGTQLTIFSPSELSSVRLLLKGEHESEKELGDLFYLSTMLNRQIKSIQYKVMSDLTNSSRDSIYINQELELRTKNLLSDLKIVEGKFYSLTIDNPLLKDSYLNYMNFGNQEDLLELAIHKYFLTDTDEYKDYIVKHLVWQSKPIYPKFKLDHLINSCNYRSL
ncbi:MAG: hypothetical protein RRZ84_04220 [Romboutsia sp.]